MDNGDLWGMVNSWVLSAGTFKYLFNEFPYGHETTLNLCSKLIFKCIETTLFWVIYEYFRESLIQEVSTLTGKWYKGGKLIVQDKIREWEWKATYCLLPSEQRRKPGKEDANTLSYGSFPLLAGKEENGQRRKARILRNSRARHERGPWNSSHWWAKTHCSWVLKQLWSKLTPSYSKVPKTSYTTGELRQGFYSSRCWGFRMPITLCPQLLKSIVYKYRTCKNKSISYKNESKCLITPIGQDSQATPTWKTKVGPQDQIASCYFSWILRLILARSRSERWIWVKFPRKIIDPPLKTQSQNSECEKLLLDSRQMPLGT